MKPDYFNFVGQRFSKLIILELLPFQKGEEVKFKCLCDCGKVKDIFARNIKRGLTKSCGCGIGEMAKLIHTHHGNHTLTFTTSEYNAWCNMKARCGRPNHPQYPDYGARGIFVCDRWISSFENFILDMGDKPSEKHTLERVDNDKEYSPENCKWDTRPNQNRNRRSNVYIEYNGLNLCIQDWAILLNTKFMNIKNALVRGKTFDYIYNKYKKNENDNL
ncbi:MAG TPA: hypothetical protein PLX17_02230 [Chitinophagaceae bacterium]|nr:hypothetical protein [Chitinophagaceae bacterium]